MRWDIINNLIKKYDCTSYLEIGVQKCINFNKIQCEWKAGVDPDVSRKQIFTVDSDTFFGFNTAQYDLVFIDGLHHAGQVERDIVNAINLGAKVVVLHDCIPVSEAAQIVPRVTREWNGDVWRAFAGFIKKYPEFETYTHTEDHGVGVIICNGQKVEPGFCLDIPYSEFTPEMVNVL